MIIEDLCYMPLFDEAMCDVYTHLCSMCFRDNVWFLNFLATLGEFLESWDFCCTPHFNVYIELCLLLYVLYMYFSHLNVLGV